MKQKFGCMLVISALLLAGCVSYPKQVTVPDNTVLISYQAAAQGGVQQGTARWSGVIANIQNNPTDTRLEIVYFDSNKNGRPKVSDETAGRFVAYIKGFLDPVVYQVGKSVTVLGQLSQSETGQVDKYQYVFPVIQQSTVYVWPLLQPEINVIDLWPMWRHPEPRWNYRQQTLIRASKQASVTSPQGPVHVDNFLQVSTKS